MSTLRPSTLLRSAAAAALACFVAADAYASDPAPSAPPVDQTEKVAAESSLSLLNRMNGDEPLFLVGGKSEPVTGAPSDAEEVNWGMRGVLRDPHGKLFALNSQDGTEMLRLGGTGRFFFSTLYYEPFDGADADDVAYWLTKTPTERIEAGEYLRRWVYGDAEVNARLQRVLSTARLGED